MSHRKSVSSAGITPTSVSRLHRLSTVFREKKEREAGVEPVTELAGTAVCAGGAGHRLFRDGTHTLNFPRLALNFELCSG